MSDNGKKYDLEVEIAKKYKYITMSDGIGVTDTLRALTAPEMLPLLKEYVAELEKPSEPKYVWVLNTDPFLNPSSGIIQARVTTSYPALVGVFSAARFVYLDGVRLHHGDIVLLRGQTDESENGLWIWLDNAGLSRMLPNPVKLPVRVTEGQQWADTVWVQE